MTDSFSKDILKLNEWSYNQGSIDSLKNMIDALNATSKLTGIKQFPIDGIIQMMDQVVKDLEKGHTEKPLAKPERGCGDDYPIIPQ